MRARSLLVAVLGVDAAVLGQAAGIATDCDGDVAVEQCLDRLAGSGLGALGATRELVQTCGDENPLLELFAEPQRLPSGNTGNAFRNMLEVTAANRGHGALPDSLAFHATAFGAFRRHAVKIWRLLVAHAHGCSFGPGCVATEDIANMLQNMHAEFLGAMAVVVSQAADSPSSSTTRRWVSSIGDAAQVVSRRAFDQRHLDFAVSVISGLRSAGPESAIGLLHDLVVRVASANCEMQAELLAHFTFVELSPGRVWPRLEFHSGFCCRRYHALAQLISALAPEASSDRSRARGLDGAPPPLHMVEVGVNNAITSEYLLRRFPDIKYDGVDPFFDAEDIRNEAEQRFGRFGDRARLWRATSEAAVQLFEPASLDVVFIDGDHSREGVAADVRVWRPIVRPGGVLAGHDLFNPAFEGVLEALLDHLQQGMEDPSSDVPTIHFAPDYVWWLQL